MNFKSFFIGATAFFFLNMAYASDCNHHFKVTVTNLTKGQVLTPPVLAIHSPMTKILSLGRPVSRGFASLATDGLTKDFEKELEQKKGVVRFKVGQTPILPGQSLEISIKATNPKYKLAVFSMLARTNDAVLWLEGLALDKKTYLAAAFDAGVEFNSERCADIPAPPCNGRLKGELDTVSFLRPHEGLLFPYLGSLKRERDAFASKVAKVEIKPSSCGY